MPNPDTPDLPYAGLRVLDLSQGLAGPYCAMLLAQHGADVVKVEPHGGDWARGLGAPHGAHTALSLAANRGKRSLAVDLKHPAGLAAIRRLADRADVILESFRPGVAARLGLGYDTIAAANPGVVYLSVSGFGQHGPMAQRSGTDSVLQAFTGMMDVNRDADGRPQRVGMLAVDTSTALYAFQAVAAALYGRLRGGSGRRLEVSLMQAAAAFLAPKVIEASLEGDAPVPLSVPTGNYRTRDGWIAIALSKEPHFAALCLATGCEDLLSDPRYGSFVLRAEHAPELRTRLSRAIVQRDTAQWLERFAAAGLLASRVNTVLDWLEEPQAAATGAVTRERADGTAGFALPAIPGVAAPAPGDPRGAWSAIGADGEQVLREAGFGADEIAALRRDGVLA